MPAAHPATAGTAALVQRASSGGGRTPGCQRRRQRSQVGSPCEPFEEAQGSYCWGWFASSGNGARRGGYDGRRSG